MPRVIALIPARYGSTRFPGKPLASIAGKPMIEHVYTRTARAETIDRVIVATDDERILQAVAAFGGDAVLTRADHPTGTDRLAEVAATLDTDLVVNVQGDEPLIEPHMIDQAVAPLQANADIGMGTLAGSIDQLEDFYNPNVVKVVRDLNGLALYFSRAPIPCSRDLTGVALEQQLADLPLLRHIGLYVYRRQLLLDYPTWSKTRLEKLENLEQLRALERGIKVHVALTEYSCHGVDTPADIARIEALVGDNNRPQDPR